MSNIENQYLNLLREVLYTGYSEQDRTGVGTTSVFSARLTHDLSKGFPLLTTKKVWLKGVIHELLWMISGDTNISYLKQHGVHIWDKWSDENDDLGPVYGAQWRRWPTEDGYVDQLANVIQEIKTNPYSRRLVVSAWNAGDVPKMALPPCHMFFQFYVREGRLSCQLYQRSADLFLGVPFNIASYSLLTSMVAQVCGLKPGTFVHVIGDAHIYHNHVDQVQEQMARKPYRLPELHLNLAVRDIDAFSYDDIQVFGYKHHPAIKGEVAV